MALPYGIVERCILATTVCWLVSVLLGNLIGIHFLDLFIYFGAVIVPAVAIYSVMNVS